MDDLCKEYMKPLKLKRVRLTSGRVLDGLFCPICDHVVRDDGYIHKYCSFCGQRLNENREWEWGE